MNKYILALLVIVIIIVELYIFNPSKASIAPQITGEGANSTPLGIDQKNNLQEESVNKSWTLVVIDNDNKRTELGGFTTSNECVSKGISMSQNGEYFNCGYECKYDNSTVDDIRCNQYCGRGGCGTVDNY